MRTMQTRRDFVAAASAAGAASLLGPGPAAAAEGPLETTAVRLARSTNTCLAPVHVAEELLRAVVLARRRLELKASTRREHRRRLERDLDAVLALRPGDRHGRRLRQRYLAVRDGLFTFLEHPEVPPDDNGSERDLRPMVVYRKVTGGFRSAWGPHLCAAVTSVVGTAARRGVDAYHAILAVLSGRTVLDAG